MAAQIPLESFQDRFGSLVELSSEALGGRILSLSDEFFSPAIDLLKVPPPISKKGQFGPNGALFDGWETRRHNPNHDWVIIKLGPPSGTIVGLDIDTGHFAGNEGPAASVYACFMPDGTPTNESPEWEEILPISPLGPASRHLFALSPQFAQKPFTHVKLLMHPDGGIGRFRVYGSVIPLFPKDPSAQLDLAHSFNGGRCVAVSDQHYGVGSNLIISGRGFDMGDGWETKRSRTKGHTDWVIIKLGAPGYLDYTEIDTAHFLGNFPESCDLYGTSFDGELPSSDAEWRLLLPRTKLGPGRQAHFQLQDHDEVTTHVRMTIYPDGGVKRVRLFGRRAVEGAPRTSRVPLTSSLPAAIGDTVKAIVDKALPGTPAAAPAPGPADPMAASLPTIPALPLSPEGFAGYGHVVQAYDNPHHAPKGIRVSVVNYGTATKYNHVSPISASAAPAHPSAQQAVNLSTHVCTPYADPALGLGGPNAAKFEVRVLERHEFSTQTWLPLGAGPAARYLVVVALPGENGQPDLQTLRAFVGTGAQGFTYGANVWHHPMIALDTPTHFATITSETGHADADCEIVEFGKTVALVEEVPAV